MPIAQSVGPGQVNARADVRIVQRLLNAQSNAPGLVEDGLYGPNTWGALIATRADRAGEAPVTPDGADLKRLLAGLPAGMGYARLGCVIADQPSGYAFERGRRIARGVSALCQRRIPGAGA